MRIKIFASSNYSQLEDNFFNWAKDEKEKSGQFEILDIRVAVSGSTLYIVVLYRR